MLQAIEWNTPYHVSSGVTLEFRGENATMILLRNHASQQAISLNLDVLPLLTAFAAPTSPRQALDTLQKKLRLDEASARQAFELLSTTGIIVPWRGALSKDEALAAMARVDRWYHAFEIVPGLYTPGEVVAGPERLDVVGVPEDLSGLRVLDIGAWDGAYTFELERRGAEVVAFDIQDPNHTGFETARQIIGSSVTYKRGTIYDLSPETIGLFDAALYFGVFYHLKNPLSGFANIHTVLHEGGTLYVEGAILDTSHRVDETLHRHREALEAISDLPIAYFAPGDFHGHWSNWFVPNITCLEAWLGATGFADIQLAHIGGNRAGGRAVKDARFDPIEHEVL